MLNAIVLEHKGGACELAFDTPGLYARIFDAVHYDRRRVSSFDDIFSTITFPSMFVWPEDMLIKPHSGITSYIMTSKFVVL